MARSTSPNSLPARPDTIQYKAVSTSEEQSVPTIAAESHASASNGDSGHSNTDTDSDNDDKASESDDSDSSENSEDTADISEDDVIPREALEELLNRARVSLAAKTAAAEDPETLSLEAEKPALPPLDPGSSLPKPYFSIPTSKEQPAVLVNDPGTSSLSRAAGKRKATELEVAPLTKKQCRELREKTTGPDWFDLPAPTGADLSKIKREIEANRLRKALDPKSFYRKEGNEIPKYAALGRIVATKSPFTTSSKKNLARAERKQTIVEELVADAEARSYAKKKFSELQSVRGERGRGTVRRKKELRKQKW